MSFPSVPMRWQAGRQGLPKLRGQDDFKTLVLVQASCSQGEMYKYLPQSQTCRASFPAWSPLFGDTGVYSGDLAVWVLVGCYFHVQCLSCKPLRASALVSAIQRKPDLAI